MTPVVLRIEFGCEIESAPESGCLVVGRRTKDRHSEIDSRMVAFAFAGAAGFVG